ncbi:MAG: tRNA pseudouridine(13) synthase TruD [Gammaproteobacteria bacterium]|nr:tRNA pseudouridine(13) synthase TruD [Gammaproteobacteria bacterium]
MNLPSGGVGKVSGTIRTRPQDFRVDEALGFAPAGAGEHLLVRLEKTGANTAWVAQQLARCYGVGRRDVAFAGRKDRHAVTRQWYSVWLPGRQAPPAVQLAIEGVEVLETVRHDRKLRRGALAYNQFEITVRELHDPEQLLEQRLQAISNDGFPNYFGSQRFGHDGHNLQLARRLFAGSAKLRRNQRSMALSAARAAIFNAVLDRRIADDSWNSALAGDALILDGSGSFFSCETPDQEIAGRLQAGDIHVSGPLWGRGELPVCGAVAALERETAEQFSDLAAGLEHNRLRQERRALRILPSDMAWEITDELLLRFRLPSGVYATSLLAAAMTVHDAASAQRHS